MTSARDAHLLSPYPLSFTALIFPPMSTPTTPLSILAIVAHRDDAELTCGGTLIKAAKRGQRTGIIDLTQGEMGPRGSAALREQEASAAAEILGVAARETLGLP